MYTISDVVDSASITTYTEDGIDQVIDTQASISGSQSGLYVYNQVELFKGKIEKYKLVSTVGGQCNLIQKSRFGNRFSFIQSYNNIVIIPYPHLNVVRAVGMGQKHAYLIWRERNGFFTALDMKGTLLTWSLLTGKMLYTEK